MAAEHHNLASFVAAGDLGDHVVAGATLGIRTIDDVELEVDGGIDAETAPLAIGAGATALVAGTAAFRGGPSAYAGNIKALRGGH